MIVRIGYVAKSLNLPKVTASSTVTFSYYNKLSEEEKLNKLKKVTASNLEDLKTIIHYNIKNNIHFYRLTSNLVPLATHPDVKNWDFFTIFKEEFKSIGKHINDNHMRVDTHPDQFNVINSHREEVFQNTKTNLQIQHNVLKHLNIKDPKMILHIGGGVGGKEKAMERFVNQFKKLPDCIQKNILLENDDKVYNVVDTLNLCNELNIPMVLDVHHHKCNGKSDIHLEQYIEKILLTWQYDNLPPKIHLSSPRDFLNDRKHSDYIAIDDFYDVIRLFKEYKKDFDIMLEAKQKDLALFKLVKDIKRTEPSWQWKDESTLNII
ncbi:UV-damage endonuclease [Natranaerovirga hydrolytica]|uniref:UV-damage endonuclease n=1 Tax=Natranaerovirga hydrolytica TaxID=680378 RepID=A0A4R1M5A2_9FIRM|nr:UV DNA damage repair endonuclease UvsE [Natranaerovirga hydrolytica]TCK86767.1 UV-damage endonuclease [Natranaerovirga hydrolytica]